MRKTWLLAALLTIAAAGAAPAAEIGDDGLHKQDFFQLTFKDVAEDIESAKAEGKRLAILFEQRGCIYCIRMHEEVFSDPDVAAYIEANFHIVQYNLYGDEAVTDLDGETLSEKTAVRRWGVVFTPTILFLPEDAPDGGTVAEAAVATMPGAFGKEIVLHMFEWVKAKRYETDEHFQAYHARRLAEAKASEEGAR